MRLPSFNNITLPYGVTSEPYSKDNPHAGTDFSWSPDIYWYAPEDCIVTKVIDNASASDCGKQVDLRSLDNNRTYRGCHSDEIYVSLNQQLREGQKVGKIGSTGCADGKHLHFVMWVSGIRTDCTQYLKEDNNYMTPKECSEAFKNYAGLDIPETDSACQNREPLDFFRGLALMNYDTIKSLTRANNKLNDDLKKCETDLGICIKDFNEAQNHSWSWSEIWNAILSKFKKE